MSSKDGVGFFVLRSKVLCRSSSGIICLKRVSLVMGFLFNDHHAPRFPQFWNKSANNSPVELLHPCRQVLLKNTIVRSVVVYIYIRHLHTSFPSHYASGVFSFGSNLERFLRRIPFGEVCVRTCAQKPWPRTERAGGVSEVKRRSVEQKTKEGDVKWLWGGRTGKQQPLYSIIRYFISSVMFTTARRTPQLSFLKERGKIDSQFA